MKPYLKAVLLLSAITCMLVAAVYDILAVVTVLYHAYRTIPLVYHGIKTDIIPPLTWIYIIKMLIAFVIGHLLLATSKLIKEPLPWRTT